MRKLQMWLCKYESCEYHAWLRMIQCNEERSSRVLEFIFPATWFHILSTPCSNRKSLFSSLYFSARGLTSFGLRVRMENSCSSSLAYWHMLFQTTLKKSIPYFRSDKTRITNKDRPTKTPGLQIARISQTLYSEVFDSDKKSWWK